MHTESTSLEWIASSGPVSYSDAVAFMEQRVHEIFENKASEAIWMLEHPPLYTAGTSAKESDLLTPDRFPVYQTGRGGQHTYHGPGQRVVYVMLNLKKRGGDVRQFVRQLENWVIETLAIFGINGQRDPDNVGIWVKDARGNFNKIAAIGVRVRKWVSYHGIAINVHPELEHFSGIIPCGISNRGVTSLRQEQQNISLGDFDFALQSTCPW